MPAADRLARAALDELGVTARSAERVTTGHDAATWRVDTATEPLALRVLPPGRDPSGELTALALARRRGVPVPRVVVHGEVEGRAAIVTTWCAGRTIADLLLDGGDPSRLGRLLGAAQARLHRPDDAGGILVHLDLQPFNVLVDGERVTGIVDWANARLGDPREDVATTAVVLAFGASQFDLPDGTLDAFVDAWRAGYGRYPAAAELAPFLSDAAEVQLRTWQRRAEAGDATPATVDAARRVAESEWTGTATI